MTGPSPSYRNVVFDGGYMARSSCESGDTRAGFMGRVLHLSKKFGARKRVIAWEGGELVRQEWFPDYKGARRARNSSWEGLQAFQEALSDIQRHLPLLGFYQAVAKGWEADDVMATISRCWPGNTLIVSEDHDMNQLISKTCHVYRPARKRLDDVPDPNALYTQVLTGCKSDEVPGVRKGFGPKSAELVLRAVPNLVPMLLSSQEIPKMEGRVGRLLESISGERERCAATLSALLVTLYTVDISVVPTVPDQSGEGRRWLGRIGVSWRD